MQFRGLGVWGCRGLGFRAHDAQGRCSEAKVEHIARGFAGL